MSLFFSQDTLTDEDGSALRSDDQREESRRKRMLALREKSSLLRDKDVREKLERRLEKAEKDPIPRDLIKTEARKFSQSIPVEPSVRNTSSGHFLNLFSVESWPSFFFQPKRALMEQLSQIFPSPEEELPSLILLINGNHPLGQVQEQTSKFWVVQCPIVFDLLSSSSYRLVGRSVY